jgi:hypothetical protein
MSIVCIEPALPNDESVISRTSIKQGVSYGARHLVTTTFVQA